MKKAVLLICLFIVGYAHGQTSMYHPFPTNYGFWYYQYYDDFHVPTSFGSSYILSGDTTLLSRNYKKISQYGSSAYGYQGAIRDTNRMIYFVPSDSSAEYLLYDFNLAVGDTFVRTIGYTVSGDTFVVQQVDSVLATDGYHKRIRFPGFIEWIEGIGSVNYLLNPVLMLGVSGNDVISCVASDSNFVYPANLNHCVLSVAEDKISDNSITVFPNPSQGAFTIQLKGNAIKEISLITIDGKIIYNQTIGQQSQLTIDNLAPGIYILSATDNKDISKYKKLVVN